MTATIRKEYGVTWLNDNAYIGITSALKQLGQSENIVHWQLRKAIERHSQLLMKLNAGEITEDQYKRDSRPEELLKSPKEKRREGADMGKVNHTMLDAFSTGDADLLAETKAKAPEAFTALDLWLRENNAEFIGTEIDVFSSTLRFCGRIDAKIKTPKGIGIFELKSKDRIYWEHEIQAGFYSVCDVAVIGGEKCVNDCDFVSALLLKNGKCVEHEIDTTDTMKTLYAIKEIYRAHKPKSPIFAMPGEFK